MFKSIIKYVLFINRLLNILFTQKIFLLLRKLEKVHLL